MNLMRVAIVEDEPLAQEILQSYLQRINTFELVATCKNALEAFALLNQQSIDLLLLDINMPHISGMDFIKSLKNPPLVIFTTAYGEYAIDSYELNAVDYLLKPISFDRFLKASNKAQEMFKPMQINIPLQSQLPANTNKLLFVRSEGKWIKIDLSKLWFVEGLKDYVKLWMEDGRITVHSTMKNFEEQLSAYSNFIRVHKSHIVNLEFVSEIENNSLKIKDQIIGIGNTYKEEVYKILNDLKFI
jgi:DNA-binding LytR/AlgR family response regulator